ncbi:hypothetical protein P8H27_18050 [Pseudomonas sp. sp1636]|uniref:hypothetical protein n=1 Tax=Pseudomonas sp. sp1636 TaxID=3036707 RepID=UPI0025A54B5D|nr:hypothetical protein [Pseudomonas sp. sp1636]MDM8350783.1 hypothetical protein [Pseudomonas sp. sp1636]
MNRLIDQALADGPDAAGPLGYGASNGRAARHGVTLAWRKYCLSSLPHPLSGCTELVEVSL